MLYAFPQANVEKRVKSTGYLLPFLLVLLALAGCAAAPGPAAPVPTLNGDVIASAVAGTLEVSFAQTATVVAQLQQTEKAITPSPTTTPLNSTATVETMAVTTVVNTPVVTPTPTTLSTKAPRPSLIVIPGLTIAYIGPGNNLWLWQNAQNQQLTRSGDVAGVSLSDDGRWIAFSRSSDFIHYSLWAIAPDGQNERTLVSSAAFAALPRVPGAVAVAPVMFSWVPGSHEVAFSTRPMFEALGMMLNHDLWLVNADTLDRKELFPAETGGKFYYSPDGSQIALVKPVSISLVNADGSNRREGALTYPAVSTYSEYSYYPVPVWLPDMSGLRVVIPPKAALEQPEENTAVWQIPLDGSEASQIASVRTAPLHFPVLSPDGAMLAYLAPVGSPDENRHELHIVDADGADDTIYTTETMLSFLSWSPDANHFIFSRGQAGVNQAYIGQIGSQPQPFSDVTLITAVRWVDNERFLFVTQDQENVELRLGELSGTSTVITSFPSNEGRPLLFDFIVAQ